ncbi:MAG TPA: hypothetical protein VMY78_06700 [Solirubrobacteraceae bacterium]|nr:hypothetical protein [Solirubrobacteraceae bacterium]
MSVPAAPAAPVTATGSQPRNYCGQAIAITVFSTVRFWGRAFLPVLFAVTARFAKLTGTLRELSFIHFARWTVISKLPYNGPPQRKGRLRYPHMYFESNFNGGWEEYIDAFSHILTRGMTAFWGSSYGFPKPLPTAQFKKYIQDNETEADHYYSAYPEATSTMIQRALVLDEKFAALVRNAERMDPDAFAAAYKRFLTDTQHCL